MLGQLIFGMLLLPMLMQAPQSEQPAEPQADQQANENAIEQRIEQAIDEEAIAKQVEQHIDRVMGDVRPSEWWIHGVLALLTPFAFFALVAVIAWLLYRKSQAQMRARMDFHTQLLGKFASGKEFAEFMEGKGGQKFLEGVWSKPLDARERILRTTRAGVVLTVLGLGTLGLSLRTPGLLVPAGLVLALGVGYLTATALSYRLSKEMGLLKDKETISVETSPAEL